MTLAYLASPYTRYSAGLNAAFYDACRLTARLLATGIKCFSPIVHGHAISTHGNLDPLDLGIWYPFNDLMMDRCDVLIVAHLPGWTESDGIAYEIKTFERCCKPIFDLDCQSLKMVRRAVACAVSEQLNHEPPPCERPFQRGEIHKHPRYPSGDCVNCGALCTEGCKHELFESWEQEQTGHEAS